MKAPRVCRALLVYAAVLAASATPSCATAPTNVSSASGQPAIASGPKPGEPWESSLGMKFVPVPGANVLFCIWETRVQDFEAFVKATSYNAGEGWRDPDVASRGSNIDPDAVFSQTPLHPVTYVSWNDAVAFCGWLTEKERAEGRLSAGQEYRLPTDAEWSQAVGLPAESGATPEDKDRKIENVYPWGAGYPPPKGSGNYSGEGDGYSVPLNGYTDGAKFTAKVGSYTANRLGIYDLGGNVWEWCGDWYNAKQEDHPIRGASFNQSTPGFLLSSLHGGKPPGVRDFNLGFRCVVTVGASSP
jgi:formylglycine-generating enzyme required for sulfatase activity